MYVSTLYSPSAATQLLPSMMIEAYTTFSDVPYDLFPAAYAWSCVVPAKQAQNANSGHKLITEIR